MGYCRTLKESGSLVYAKKNLAATDKGTLKEEILDIWKGQKDGWLLGHAMNGLVWGRIEAGKVILANDADASWGAKLKRMTLLDLRVFNIDAELRIWRMDRRLHGCMVSESTQNGRCLTYEEDQILIAGNRKGCQTVNGLSFSLIEGPAGQHQAIPVNWDGRGQTYRLWVRHYIPLQSENGMLRVTDTRLLQVRRAR